MTATWIGVSSPPSGISKTYAKQNQQTAAKQPWFAVKNVVIVACSTRYFTVVRAGFAVQLVPAFFGRATSKEREQVLAHSDLFVGTVWYPEVEPYQWCKAVGLRRDDSPEYIDAIATNLAGKNPSEFTLAAIEKSRGKTAVYVFCCVPDKKSPENAFGSASKGGYRIPAKRSRHDAACCCGDPRKPA